jgi:hypothetical protein
VQFPGLVGVVPGFGRQEPNDWGLGFELRDHKAPHWTGSRNSASTFGHLAAAGRSSGSTPRRSRAHGLTDRDFGDWAKRPGRPRGRRPEESAGEPAASDTRAGRGCSVTASAAAGDRRTAGRRRRRHRAGFASGMEGRRRRTGVCGSRRTCRDCTSRPDRFVRARRDGDAIRATSFVRRSGRRRRGAEARSRRRLPACARGGLRGNTVGRGPGVGVRLTAPPDRGRRGHGRGLPAPPGPSADRRRARVGAGFDPTVRRKALGLFSR